MLHALAINIKLNPATIIKKKLKIHSLKQKKPVSIKCLQASAFEQNL